MVKLESELATIEEHLLCYHECLDRAEESERYVDVMRAGAILAGFDLDVK